VWELTRIFDDNERGARAFLTLFAFGIVTWFVTGVAVRSLLPAATLASLLAVVFGLVGWRAARNEQPREASNFVAVLLVFALAACWVVSVLAVLARAA
jgi:hypothetical protein